MQPLEVTFVSHACLRIKGAFGSLICDPWILNEPVYNFSTWKFPAAIIPPEALIKDLDYLFITHSHEDHFHVPSLNYFPRDTQILLPEYAMHPGLRAQTIERVLRGMGFYNIRKLLPWTSVDLGGGTSFTFIPSASKRSHDWENAGFAIEDNSCVLLNMNDNLTDEQLCADIKSRWANIDVAFIQAAGVTMYPGCFRMSPEKMLAEAKKRKIALADQRRMIELIQPRRIVPFAGDFCWLDERYERNNWAGRATPKVFSDLMEKDYPGSNIELINMLPSDTWSMKNGLTQNHPAVDWDHYLDEIEKVKIAFRPKISAIREWINAAPDHALHERTVKHAKYVEKHVTRDYIDFSARFRLAVEGDKHQFSFVTKASPETGFSIDFDDDDPVDQTLYIPQEIWAAVLDGRLTWNIIQWVGEAEQHVDYRQDMGRFWFWMEYHIDLNSKNPQYILEPRLYPDLERPIDANRGVFKMEDEWSLSWLKN